MSDTIDTLILDKKSQEVISQAINDPVDAIRSLGGLDFYEFLQVFWEQITLDEFVDNWHIPMLCNELQTLAERVAKKQPKEYDLIVNIPPGTTKTIICLIAFPAWAWTKWYWMQFIAASHSMPIALKSATKCRDLVRSDKYKMIYPWLDIKADEDTKSDFRVVKKTYVKAGHVPRISIGGGRFTCSVGGSVTGMHGHIVLIDDPIDPRKAISDAEIESANHWMDETIPTRKVNKEVTPTVLIMQRLHQNDPSGHLLEKKEKRIRHICLPGEIVNYNKYIQPKEFKEYYKNGLLDPTRMSWTVLKDMEIDMGQYGFAGQVGQNPTPPGGGMFKVDHFQMIQTMIPEVSIMQTIRYWDKAATDEAELKKGRDAAYTVGVKMILTDRGKYIVADVKRGRWETNERERIIRETAEVDGQKVLVMTEQEPGSGGKDSVRSTITNLAGYHCEGDPVSGKGSKPIRADIYSVQVNNGNVLLLSGDWNREFVEEHRFFPFSKYKDQVDAAAGAFNKLTKKKQVKIYT